MSCCMPSAVGILTGTFAAGKRRNIAFAAFGGGSPIGIAFGLVLGGIFVQLADWRIAYYFSAGVNAIILVAAWFAIPKFATDTNKRRRLIKELDWIGVIIASSCLALLSYVFANMTYSCTEIYKLVNIALLTVATYLIPIFIFWIGCQERANRPAIIPNSVWLKPEFTSICLTVFLTWPSFDRSGYWTTPLFQDYQNMSAMSTSFHILPLVIIGLLTNILTGLPVEKIPANTIVIVSCILSCISSLLFSVMNPIHTYWAAAFPAMILNPISSNVLFSISNLIITSTFSGRDQALAGGIFNTVTQLENSLGLAITAVVAARDLSDGMSSHNDDPNASMLAG